MSLADRAGGCRKRPRSWLLLGDPATIGTGRRKGSHPDGAEKSALEHLLMGGRRFRQTWDFYCRRHGGCIQKFASTLRNFSNDISCVRILFRGAGCLKGTNGSMGTGLWFVPVEHEGNRNSSARRSRVAARIVEGLLKPEVKWFYGAGNSRRLKEEDILIVAPYKTRTVSDLCRATAQDADWDGGQVSGSRSTGGDLFADHVVPEEAPRGMEFCTA